MLTWLAVRRIDKVKTWLANTCGYQEIYEHRVGQKHSNSCSWFLDTLEYSRWKNRPFEEQPANDLDSLSSNWHERVLFVQGEYTSLKKFLPSNSHSPDLMRPSLYTECVFHGMSDSARGKSSASKSCHAHVPLPTFHLN
jgi:hypothetical protein